MPGSLDKDIKGNVLREKCPKGRRRRRRKKKMLPHNHHLPLTSLCNNQVNGRDCVTSFIQSAGALTGSQKLLRPSSEPCLKGSHFRSRLALRTQVFSQRHNMDPQQIRSSSLKAGGTDTGKRLKEIYLPDVSDVSSAPHGSVENISIRTLPRPFILQSPRTR